VFRFEPAHQLLSSRRRQYLFRHNYHLILVLILVRETTD
jgi:hypothetical protein